MRMSSSDVVVAYICNKQGHSLALFKFGPTDNTSSDIIICEKCGMSLEDIRKHPEERNG